MGLIAGPAMANPADNIKVNGFVDFEYEISDDDVKGDTKGSFDSYHFNILTEYAVSEAVTAKLHLEYEHSPVFEGHEGDKDATSGSGELKVEWSYIEFLLSNTTKVRAGKNLTPFGIYNEIHDATPTYNSMRTPWGIYKAGSVGGHDTFPKFSTGLFLLGDHYTNNDMNINYVFYIANGENDTKNEAKEDENTNKAVGGRIGISPIEDINLSASIFNGKAGVAEADHSAWGVSAEYVPYPLAARAEYATSDNDTDEQESWYVEAAYSVKKLTPFFRYGWLDPDKTANDDEWEEAVIGINYQWQPNVVFKLENRSFGGNPGNSDVTEDYNEIGAAVTVAF
jgi:hypothetical protein